MRFHHSTRRGRTKFSQAGAAARAGAASHSSLSNRWAQLSYCRQTNIHFNRRLPVDVPESVLLSQQQAAAGEQSNGNNQQTIDLFGDAHLAAILRDHSPVQAGADQQEHSSFAAAAAANHRQQWDASSGKTLEQHMNELRLATDLDTSQTQIEARLANHSTCPSTMSPSSTASSRSKSNMSSTGSSRRTARLFHQDSKSKLTSARHNGKRAEKASEATSTSGSSANGDKLRPAEGGAQAAGNKLDIESARAKLIAQVDKHRFWSNKAAKRMRLLDIDERKILIYELISYCEKRDLEWRYEPYRGGLVAGTGPFSGATTISAGAGVGVRRVLSSVGGERVPPPAAQLISAAGDNNTDSQRLLCSLSQPASPLRNGIRGGAKTPINRTETNLASAARSNSILQQTPTHQYQSQHRFTYEESPPTPLSPASSLGGRGDAAASYQHLYQQQQQLRDTPTHAPSKLDKSRRQAIRRTCSSAATSPVQSPSSPGAGSTSFEQTGAGSSLLQSFGEPRPLPSAELVWSIEPPEHLRPAPFVSYIHTTAVPDTSFVKRCHGCQGRGRLKCTSCYGVGYEVCISCSGKGTMKSLSGGAASGAGQQSSQHGRGGHDSASSTVGSMWSNAPDSGGGASESRYGSGRHDEPGGITGAGGHSGLSAWTTESCHFCHGAGQKRCWICAGRAYNTCTACAGTGQLRCYLNLNITWMNHRDECVLNNTDSIIPHDRLKLSSGLLLADEVAAKLEPIASRNICTQLKLLELSRAAAVAPASGAFNSSPPSEPPPPPATSTNGAPTAPLVGSHATRDGAAGPAMGAHQVESATAKTAPTPTPSDLNGSEKHFGPTRGPQQHLLEQVVKPSEMSQLHLFSSKLLEKHWAAYGRSERLLMQRHRVTQIECYLVNWEWKRRRGHFVIYGDERKVYIAKYPFKSICNIT